MKRKILRMLIPILISINIYSPSYSLYEKDAVSIVIVDKQSGSKSVITAKGKGFPPNSSKNASQAHLLARRAALVDAYRNLLRAFDDIKVYVSGSDKYIAERGFIEGVKVLSEETYPDGKVEVRVCLEVGLRGMGRVKSIERTGYRVVYGEIEVKKPYRVISREEWMELNVRE